MIPISLISHHVFCPRRAWLEANGEKTDTYQMAVGTAEHKAADLPLVKGERTTALEVSSESLQIIGRCDAVRHHSDGSVSVVEHKSTPVRRKPEPTEANRVQLALQAMSLEESGMTVREGQVWFSTHKKLVVVPITDELRVTAIEHAMATHQVVDSATAPAPLVGDPPCTRCSHISVCLPDEKRQAPTRRSIQVSDPDSRIVHLSTPGSRASTRKGRLVATKGDQELASLPMDAVQGLVVHGNVDVSSALLRDLMWNGLSIIWCSFGGKVVGWSSSAHSPNGSLRPIQALASLEGRLDLAREFVSAKISNQATLLRRSSGQDVNGMRTLQRQALETSSLEELLGVEGAAARTYFGSLPKMLSDSLEDPLRAFPGRQQRPARDPLNAALNLAYGLLLSDALRAVLSCGMDPHAGFLHSSGRNKPALALDLMEEFRAPVADSAVLRAFNNGEVGTQDFMMLDGTCRLRDAGRKAIISAYESRVTSQFAHPVFGYQVSWRRAMEVQARMVLGVLEGSQSSYVGVRTR